MTESSGAEIVDGTTYAVHTTDGTTYLTDAESATDAEVSYGLARLAESIERSGSIGGERLG